MTRPHKQTQVGVKYFFEDNLVVFFYSNIHENIKKRGKKKCVFEEQRLFT